MGTSGCAQVEIPSSVDLGTTDYSWKGDVTTAIVPGVAQCQNGGTRGDVPVKECPGQNGQVNRESL
jgi:hypothetical protein